MLFTEAYSENDKLAVIEDLDFIRLAEKAVGWSPLTLDQRSYLNPFIKFKFYQDVLYEFERFIQITFNAGETARSRYRYKGRYPGTFLNRSMNYL